MASSPTPSPDSSTTADPVRSPSAVVLRAPKGRRAPSVQASRSRRSRPSTSGTRTANTSASAIGDYPPDTLVEVGANRCRLLRRPPMPPRADPRDVRGRLVRRDHPTGRAGGSPKSCRSTYVSRVSTHRPTCTRASGPRTTKAASTSARRNIGDSRSEERLRRLRFRWFAHQGEHNQGVGLCIDVLRLDGSVVSMQQVDAQRSPLVSGHGMPPTSASRRRLISQRARS